MRRVLKWVGFTIGGLIGLILIAVATLYFIGTAKVNKTFEIQVA